VVAACLPILFQRLGDEDTVECLDAARGERRWKFAYPTRYEDAYGKGNGPRSTPVVALGKVYTLGADGHLHCLDVKSGKKVWERKLLDDYSVKPSFFGVGTTPLVEGKLLLINVGGEGAGVVAFDAETGKERWKLTDHQASYSSPVAATVAGERRVYFFTREGFLWVDPAGARVRFFKRWRSRNNASVNAASPVVLEGDRLFLSACYGTGAVLLKKEKDVFEEIWKNDTSLSCHFGTPVAIGEQLYGFHGRQEEGAELRCIDWKTGRVRWTEAGYGCGSILAAGKKLFVLSEGGELALVNANPEKYVERAKASVLGRPCRANLALADGLLYARDGKALVCWKVKK
jgi:outer membrane protein assembly factor BamB